MSPEEAIKRLNDFYDSSQKDLDQYRNAEGEIEEWHGYDYHLRDIEMDAYELIGVLLAEVEKKPEPGEYGYEGPDCNDGMVMGTRDGEWIHPSDHYEITGEDEF
jgi:hypothetical protein